MVSQTTFFISLIERFLDDNTPEYDFKIIKKELKRYLNDYNFKILKVELIPRRPTHELEDK